MNTTAAKMPEYQCHKKVWALRISDVIYAPQPENSTSKGNAILSFHEDGYKDITVDEQWAAKHKPVPGGYYVIYADGYSSFSPAEAFESGYTLIEN